MPGRGNSGSASNNAATGQFDVARMPCTHQLGWKIARDPPWSCNSQPGVMRPALAFFTFPPRNGLLVDISVAVGPYLAVSNTSNET
jgi:hypothetical protein